MTRIPCLFREPAERTYCDRACANRHRHHRRRLPDTPRPLILARLRERLGHAPATAERLERLAPACAAADPEILALLLEGR